MNAATPGRTFGRTAMLKLLLVLLLTCSSFNRYSGDAGDQLVLKRIEYLYALKKQIANNGWGSLVDVRYDLPLIYYTDDLSYVANPTKSFIINYKPELIYNKKELKIYKTSRLNKTPFHMQTSVTFGSASSAYDYNSPFMNCSSLEITQRAVPDVNSTEQWATMVLHEYFHGYQLKHTKYREHFGKHVTTTPADSLKSLYKSKKWFKDLVDQENKLLLTALSTTDNRAIGGLLDSFFVTRNRRLTKVRQELKYDIQPVEELYETMDGTARSAEYGLYHYFANKAPDVRLAPVDSAYHAYAYFKNHKIEKDDWLYLTHKTTYFYATGFNITRLLDKFNPNYKARLFREHSLSLSQLLREQRGKLSRK